MSLNSNFAMETVVFFILWHVICQHIKFISFFFFFRVLFYEHMFDIPNQFIVSSRLSTLDSQDILTILQTAQSKWDERILLERMRKHPKTPLICIGISNPQELERVIGHDIPVIHIQSDCKALQRVQERYDRYQGYINQLLWIGTNSLWGLLGYSIQIIVGPSPDTMATAIQLNPNVYSAGYQIYGFGQTIWNKLAVKKFMQRVPPKWLGILCGSGVCLSLWTVYLMRRIKRHYKFIKDHEHVLLMRKDVMSARGHCWMQLFLPVCAFIGYSFGHLQ